MKFLFTQANGGYIIFGGYVATTVIARFDQSARNWRQLGNLLEARYGAGVAYDGHLFLVVGGRLGYDDAMSTEECKIDAKSITCTSRSPKLDNFYYWPTFIPVNHNFGQ